ncbi:PAS domain-containing protein [Methylobacterium sp. E-041]|uniref:PAS domain-containing protein n=1 Tax=Methylobacterium sp. E-041 TaxID=2836573 RepID=UPI001FBA4A34|nr:PAS domain-containing protein [Methylobacterium sp. E-041]MCJ2109188.1 PAS domain-containing protein [Methylobacterium sp. E-041]
MSDALAFLAGGGEAARMIRERDWTGHPLGMPETWSEGFRIALSLVLTSPESMILTWGPDLHFFFNDTYFPLLGPRLEWAMGERFDVVWADAWEQAKPIIDDAFAGRSRRFDDLPWKLGTDRGEADTWFSFSYSRVLDGAGRVAGLFIFTNETTARVLGDRALRESEEHYRQTVELNPQVPWTCDPAGNITSYSNRWLELTGQAPGEPDGAGWLKALHPDDIPATLDAFGSALASGEPVDVDYRLRMAATGEHRWMRARARPRRNEGGGIVRWYGVVEDVHDRKLAEAALREMNETLERRVEEALLQRKLWSEVFETTDALVGALDADFRLLAANRAWIEGFEAFSGIRPRVGDRILDHLAHRPGLLDPVREIWGRALAGEEFTLVEAFGDPDSERPYYEIKFTTLRDPEGRRIGAFQYVQDVTQRLRDQDRLAKAEEALRQSQKLEAVGQLTGGVAHDFNNLLTIIRSSVDFLRRPDLSEERRTRYMDAVSDTVDRAAKLTGQLLAFARRQTLKPQVFDVGRQVAAVADMLDTVTGARIRVVTEVPDAPCYVKADLSQFETALINMAVNARDAMDSEGTLTLRLVCACRLPDIRGHAGSAGPFAAVSLTDTGSGIAPDQVARIFEPFFTTKEVGKGTGLGLSQVFGFAKQSGGDVDVESTPGQGTTFTLYLPESEAIASDAPDPQRGDETFQTGDGQRVLVVEDNVEVGRFATQILEDCGYRTTWAANAEEALDRLGPDGSGFDAVFSDVVMPGMGGIALARLLQRRLPGLPVLLASGYSHVLAQDGLEGFELLHKPYSADQLSRILGTLMARQAGAPGMGRT